MKKHIVIAFVYALAAMACGVFYREFTKGFDFFAPTALGKVHTHFFLLGMVVFLLVALFDARLGLQKDKLYKPFMGLYNAGVACASVMMLVRGILQVTGVSLSSGADAGVSGVAGIGHAVTAIGLIVLFVMLIRRARADKIPAGMEQSAENGESGGGFQTE